MACFLVPTAEAAVVTAIRKAEEHKNPSSVGEVKASEHVESIEGENPIARKLHWLTNMLWGGSVLLAFEHIWHGEVVPWFPFLTAMNDPGDAAEMFHEMATVGVTMAILITVVWGCMVAVTNMIEKRQSAPEEKPTEA